MKWNFRSQELIEDNRHHCIYRIVTEEEHPKQYIAKVLHDSAETLQSLAALKNEAKFLKFLKETDGVIDLIACEKINNRWHLILENIDGHSLDYYLHHKQLSFAQKLSISIQLCEILAKVHNEGVTHRDIKPQNIIWNPTDNKLQIIDFGSASKLSSEKLTLETRNLAGSLNYCSPEQTGRMNRSVDYRTDIYSLGVTFYELFTERPMFDESDNLAIIHAHIAKIPIPPSNISNDIPPIISDIILRMVAKNADDRYQSAGGIAKDLEQAFEEYLKTGHISTFPLGRYDHSIVFRIPQKLYGREKQHEKLLSCFQEVCQNRCQVVFVAGYSGIGKTALIHEIQRPLVERRGFFIEGKFDQLSKNKPYSAFIEAFKSLIKQVLNYPDEVVSDWKQNILAATYPNTSVLIDVIPELETITGTQECAPELPNSENAKRFTHTLHAFLELFIQPAHPLIIFIDDLQWADLASLDLIKEITSNSEKSLLFIGAYRDNEVDKSHPLVSLVKDMNATHTTIHNIELQPLENTDVSQLIQDTLDLTAEQVKPLSDLCHARTVGNPFFLTTFLYTLVEQQSIYFDTKLNQWTFDLEKAQSTCVTNNVVELLIADLNTLQPYEQTTISIAACIGNVFDASLLCKIQQNSLIQTLQNIQKLMEDNYIISLSNDYKAYLYTEDSIPKTNCLPNLQFRFVHDRVQEAGLKLLSQDQKQNIRLTVGRMLLEKYQEGCPKVSVFSLVEQFNETELPLTTEEGPIIASINLEASIHAMRSIAYESASTYAQKGITLLNAKEMWSKHYDLAFALHTNLAQSEHYAGRTKSSQSISSYLLENAKTNVDKANVYAFIISQQVQLLELDEAIKLGIEALSLLNIKLPITPTPKDLEAAKNETILAIKNKNPQSLTEHPEVSQPEYIATHELIRCIHAAAYKINPPLMKLLIFLGIRISLLHGNHPASAAHYAWYAAILAHQGKKQALDWGLLAITLVDRFKATSLRAQISCLRAAVIDHPFTGIRSTFASIKEAVQSGKNFGDYNYATYANFHGLNGLMITGAPLHEWKREAEKALQFAKQIHLMEIVFQTHIQMTNALMGKTEDLSSLSGDYFNEDTFLTQHSKQPFIAYDFYIKKTILLYLAGQHVEGYHMAKMCAEGITSALFGSNIGRYAQFWYGMAIAAYYPSIYTESEKNQLHKDLKNQREIIHKFAQTCEEDYRFALYLIDAELKCIEDADLEHIIIQYELAIEEATKNSCSNHAAIAAERIMRYLTRKNLPRLAEPYFYLTLKYYNQWGAVGKIRNLEQEFTTNYNTSVYSTNTSSAIRTRNISDHALTTHASTTSISSAELDFTSILKAARYISEEVKLDKLLEKVIDTALENAGAQRAVFILKDELSNQLLVQADGTASSAGLSSLLKDIHLPDFESISQSIVRYVSRCKQHIVLSNACEDSDYGCDTYFQKTNMKSVLCMPILSREKLTGVFYLENKDVISVFTEHHIQSLDILASQAAISIENARLYKNLEDRVAQRTAELSAKNRDIQAILQNLKQGIFTILEDGTIHPEYSIHLESIFECTNLAGQDGFTLLFTDCELGCDAKDRIEATLMMTLGQNSLMFEANSSHLIREYTKTINEQIKVLQIDWEPLYDDNEDLERLMVIVRDVTQLRALEQEAAKQSLEMSMLGEILQIPVDSFQDFLSGSFEYIKQNRQLLQMEQSTIQENVINELFRNIHTIKGNARTYALNSLVDCVHEAEQSYQAYRGLSNTQLDTTRLLDELQIVEDTLTHYAHISQEKLGLRSGDDNERKSRFIDQVSEVFGSLDKDVFSDPQANRALLLTLQEAFFRLNTRSTEDFLQELFSSLPSLASALNKPAPKVIVNDCGIRFQPQVGSLLKDIFTHCFRNSIDHGIEPPEIRQTRGKPNFGTIQLDISQQANFVKFHLYDDGQGLNLCGLHNKAVQSGIFLENEIVSDEKIAEMIFRSGVTTAKKLSDISGRGAGMDAVKSFIESKGGNLEIVFTGPRDSEGFRPFLLQISLPIDLGCLGILTSATTNSNSKQTKERQETQTDI